MTAIAAIGVLAGAILLYYGIRALMRTLAVRELAALPLVEQQTVTLPAPGEIVLALRGKMFSTAFRGVAFDLRDARTGTGVPGSPVLVRSSRTNLAGVTTLSVRRFTIPSAGTFVLIVSGLKPEIDYKEARLVLHRARGAAIVLHILWIVGASALLVSTLVIGALSAAGVIGGA